MTVPHQYQTDNVISMKWNIKVECVRTFHIKSKEMLCNPNSVLCLCIPFYTNSLTDQQPSLLMSILLNPKMIMMSIMLMLVEDAQTEEGIKWKWERVKKRDRTSNSPSFHFITYARNDDHREAE